MQKCRESRRGRRSGVVSQMETGGRRHRGRYHVRNSILGRKAGSARAEYPPVAAVPITAREAGHQCKTNR